MLYQYSKNDGHGGFPPSASLVLLEVRRDGLGILNNTDHAEGLTLPGMG